MKEKEKKKRKQKCGNTYFDYSTRASVEETSIREEDRTGMTGEKARSHDERYIGVI